MPEGPEVKTVVDSLNQSLKGDKIIKINILPNFSHYDKWNGPKDEEYPLIIQEVKCKGKNIFFVLNGDRWLYSHLIMTGKWLWRKGKYTTIELLLNDDKVLYFDDQRKFGHFKFMNRLQYESKLKSIGPDLLSDNITYEKWNDVMTKIIQNKRIKKKQICHILMEQKYFSGIGNYLKSEILYRASIRPDRTVDTISENEMKRLYRITIKTIKESYQNKGLTIKDYLTPSGKRGTFKILVYGKKNGKDPNGHNIRTDIFKDGRTTYWVPEVQK